MNFIRFAVEGYTDVPVAQRLIRAAGQEPMPSYVVTHGKHRLALRIPEILGSAGKLDWLILRDLDHDAPCPSALVRQLTRHQPPRRLQLRIAVRAMESWLLADHQGFAEEFAIGANHLPVRPDELDDPKQQVIDLCRRSRDAEIRTMMTPRRESGRRVGPQYTSRIANFAREHWCPARAATRSPSLSRALVALRRSPEDGGWGR